VSNTERYRGQHAEIMRLASDLKRRLIPASLAADCAPVHTILGQLGGKLFVHLAAEDSVLYPKLLRSPDTTIREVAQDFVDEMQPISKAFKAYAIRWGTSRAIQSDVQGFITETRKILAALDERMRCEHTDLYALVDQMPA
jgi:hypothetical protein